MQYLQLQVTKQNQHNLSRLGLLQGDPSPTSPGLQDIDLSACTSQIIPRGKGFEVTRNPRVPSKEVLRKPHIPDVWN